MDISSFSRCLKDLIVEYDKVGVPFIGYFISEMAPAKYSFSRTMIYPPGRNLSFREHITTLKDCDMLVDRVSREDGVPKLQAARELRELCEVMCRDLEQGGRCVLPGVGVLEIGKDGGIDFKAEEGLDIFPEGVALEPVFIKEINGAAVSSEGAIATPASQSRNGRRIVLWCVVGIVAAAILFLVAMYVFKEQFAPLSERIINSIDALLDSLLYSDEDLRLLGK